MINQAHKPITRKRFIKQCAAVTVGAALGAGCSKNTVRADRMNAIQSTTIGGITIHAIPTGQVKVKRSHRNQSLGIPAIMVDPAWTEWMPIYSWVIEHPEGVILVDTGENADVNDKNYFSCDKINGFVYRTILKFQIRKQDELAAQLKKINLKPDDVRWVVLTHLHLDHVDGIQYFPNAEFLLSRTESQRPVGNVPCLLPSWFSPRLVEYTETTMPGFASAYFLTQAGDVAIVPTPGHTHGHQSVLLMNDESHVLFAGDTSFDQQQLLSDQVAGISADKKLTRDTYRRIPL